MCHEDNKRTSPSSMYAGEKHWKGHTHTEIVTLVMYMCFFISRDRDIYLHTY